MSRTTHASPLLTAAGLAVLLALAPAAAPAADSIEAELDWGERYRITAPVAGRIDAIEVRPGARVEQDAPLFRLDTRRAQAELRMASAAIERLRMELDEAERELHKAEDLYDQMLIAARELELARIDHATAEARLAEARARRDRARADVDDAVVRAPADGRIVQIEVGRGQFVNPALAPEVLAVLGADDVLSARGIVSAERAAGLQPGQGARVVVGDHAFDGEIVSVGWEPEGEGADRGYVVTVEFSAPELALRPGQSARIEPNANE